MPSTATQRGRPFWGRTYAFLFRFLGPADLGDPNEPPPGKPPVDGPCPGCGEPMASHTYVETPGRRRMRCPTATRTSAAK
jgi:hypothetical protein